jgi:hypothetical protein
LCLRPGGIRLIQSASTLRDQYLLVLASISRPAVSTRTSHARPGHAAVSLSSCIRCETITGAYVDTVPSDHHVPSFFRCNLDGCESPWCSSLLPSASYDLFLARFLVSLDSWRASAGPSLLHLPHFPPLRRIHHSRPGLTDYGQRATDPDQGTQVRFRDKDHAHAHSRVHSRTPHSRVSPGRRNSTNPCPNPAPSRPGPASAWQLPP